MVRQLGRAVTTTAVLLLGAVIGAWLSLSAAYFALEPAERNASNVLLVAVLVALLAGLAILTRRLSGVPGLAAFALVAMLGAVATALVIL